MRDLNLVEPRVVKDFKALLAHDTGWCFVARFILHVRFVFVAVSLDRACHTPAPVATLPEAFARLAADLPSRTRWSAGPTR
jgi:hypothetical protein